MFLVLSSVFYVFSMYQNVLVCLRFHTNLTKIYDTLNKIKLYINKSIEFAKQTFLIKTKKLLSYTSFNKETDFHLNVLNEFSLKIQKINNTFSVKNIAEIGNVLHLFYQIHNNDDIYKSWLYLCDLNTFIEMTNGIAMTVQKKQMQYCDFISNAESEAESEAKSEAKSEAESEAESFCTKETEISNATSFCTKATDKSEAKSEAKSDAKNKLFSSHYAMLNNTDIVPVKNNIRLDINTIITGPNASGKTTVLKSTLINLILSQQWGCGFYSKKTKIHPYHHFHCYLNIPDTSGRDSLFQAEARRCKNIIEEIQLNKKDRHFCVFDELYSGTNPDEAIVGGYSFMTYLAKNRNVTSILTTHYTSLCDELDNNLNIENKQMKVDFLEKKLIYTYKIISGISKIKGGIQVLKDMNYPKEMIQEIEKKYQENK
jgi:DNA mismatch repair ATPase MutS